MSSSVMSISMSAGIFSGQARIGRLAEDLLEDAAQDDALGLAGAAEGHLDVDRLVELDLHEVGVDEARA